MTLLFCYYQAARFVIQPKRKNQTNIVWLSRIWFQSKGKWRSGAKRASKWRFSRDLLMFACSFCDYFDVASPKRRNIMITYWVQGKTSCKIAARRIFFLHSSKFHTYKGDITNAAVTHRSIQIQDLTEKFKLLPSLEFPLPLKGWHRKASWPLARDDPQRLWLISFNT